MSDSDSDGGLFLSAEAMAALRQVVDLPSTDIADDTDDVQKLLAQFGVGGGAQEDSDDSEEEEGEFQSSGFDYKAYYAERNKGQGNREEKPLPKVALVQVDDKYLESCIQAAFSHRKEWTLYTNPSDVPEGVAVGYNWSEYEQLDWDSPLLLEERVVYSCYFNRKGVIRKDHLAQNAARWVAKRPDSILRDSVPESLILEPAMCDTGAAAVEAWKSAAKSFDGNLYILKPSFTNQGSGIEIVSSEDDLEGKVDAADELQRAGGFVLQRYIDHPLLLTEGRKFHLRVYVLVSGNFDVYVYTKFLALFASQVYSDAPVSNKFAHLTNTCFQSNSDTSEVELVKLFQQLGPEFVECGIANSEEEAQHAIEKVEDDVCLIIEEVFKAVSNEMTFQTRPNCFEMFGFDLMLDNDMRVWLLEANAEPDFKQTGSELQHIVANLIEEVVGITVDESDYFPSNEGKGDTQHEQEDTNGLRKVYQHRRFG